MLPEILYYLTIKPLELLFETIFFISYRFIGKPFATIVALSVFVNILVFPLYRRSDMLQAAQREREKEMEPRLSHIKKTFKGDERVLMTQAFYRISDYKPVYALRGMSSLLLQIPFFIAAYRFLSGLELLKGMPSILMKLPWNEAAAYLIADLGAPDGMLKVGGNSINVLPILMTIINIVSGTIYTKGHLLKEKIQLVVTALVFLVLLYNSPSGLVIYWTSNNIFSLIKNLFQTVFIKSKNTARFKNAGLYKAHILYDKLFLVSSLTLALFTGLYIPSTVIADSPLGFVDSYTDISPLMYVVYSASISIGLFVIWIGIYYAFSDHRYRKIISELLFCSSFIAIIDYLMSGSGLGPLTSNYIYDKSPGFETKYIFLNLIIVLIAGFLSGLFLHYLKKFSVTLLLAVLAAAICVSSVNIKTVLREYQDYLRIKSESDEYDLMPSFSLSKTADNVVVIMLDRAVGAMMPYILFERMDLMQTFDGFKYYHDTVSFGRSTNLGMPSVFGGYEYSPFELNKRDNELLSDKNNEALLVLPVLFDSNGYEVTVLDPPYAGYSEIPDLSIYDDYPNINKFISQGKFNDELYYLVEETLEDRKRNTFCFGFTKIMPLFLHNLFYNNGNYNYEHVVSEFSNDDIRISNSINPAFVSWYSVLDNMASMTEINDNSNGSFLMMYNATSHEPNLLQLPEYKPSLHVDNTAFDQEKYFTVNGVHLNMYSSEQISHYHVTMCSLLRIGEWLDYLKEQGVYDNTRIIIVSDHGMYNDYFDGFKFGTPSGKEPVEWYLPLFMVKDFNEHGFKFSDEFMTNADACVAAVSGGVVENPVNPFTGNPLDGHEKIDDKVIVTISKDASVDSQKTVFSPGEWYVVSGSPYDINNWSYYGYE